MTTLFSSPLAQTYAELIAYPKFAEVFLTNQKVSLKTFITIFEGEDDAYIKGFILPTILGRPSENIYNISSTFENFLRSGKLDILNFLKEKLQFSSTTSLLNEYLAVITGRLSLFSLWTTQKFAKALLKRELKKRKKTFLEESSKRELLIIIMTLQTLRRKERSEVSELLTTDELREVLLNKK